MWLSKSAVGVGLPKPCVGVLATELELFEVDSPMST